MGCSGGFEQETGRGMTWHWGDQAHTEVHSSLATFLWPQDEMLPPVPITHTMCQTHPAELPVKCKNLWCFWATTPLSAQSMSLIPVISTKRSFKCVRVWEQATLWPCFHTKAVPSNTDLTSKCNSKGGCGYITVLQGTSGAQWSVLRHQRDGFWPLNFTEKHLISLSGLCSRLLQRLKQKQKSSEPQCLALLPVPAKLCHEIKLWGCVCTSENPRPHRMALKEWGNLENCLGRKSGKLIIRNLLLTSVRVSSHWNAKIFTQSDPSPPRDECPVPAPCQANSALTDSSFKLSDQV